MWIPFLHDAYGLAGAWCWIRQKDDNCDSLLAGKIEQYVLGYGPVSFLCIVAMVIVAAMLVKENKKILTKSGIKKSATGPQCKPTRN